MMRYTLLFISCVLLSLSVCAQRGKKTQQQAKQPTKKEAAKARDKKNTSNKTAKQKTAGTKPTVTNTAASNYSDADTTIKGATIEIVQTYKPEVKQAPKPEYIPTLPPTDTSRPRFSYDPPEQTLYFAYRSNPIRPLALGRDTTSLPYPNYIKLGGGNLSTLYLDAGIGGLKGRNYETAFHAHHLSQEGNIRYQKVALTGLEAKGVYYTSQAKWHAQLNFNRNQYFRYGYDHAAYPNMPVPQQTFWGTQAAIGLQSAKARLTDLAYSPKLGISYLSGPRHINESIVSIDVPFTRQIDSSMQVFLGIKGDFAFLSGANWNYGNHIFQIVPGAKFNYGGFDAYVAVKPTFGKNNVTYLIPDVNTSFRFPNSQVSVSAGWQSRLVQNSYHELTQRNPFFSPVDSFYNTRQTLSHELFGQFQTNLGKHLSFVARASWWEYNNLPLFVNNLGDHKDFYSVYDTKLKAFSLQVGAKYQIADNFSIGLSGIFRKFDGSQYVQVWGEPGTIFKSDISTRLLSNKLVLTAYLQYMDNIYAPRDTSFFYDIKQTPVFDIGLGGEYQIVPRLSAFMQINNLLNNKYERWYGYQAFGINIYGGLRLKF